MIFQMAVRVAGFAFRGGAEHGGDIVIAFDIGLLREIEIAAIGLAFAGKRFFEVFPGLGVVQGGHWGGPFFKLRTQLGPAGRPCQQFRIVLMKNF